MLKRGLKEVLIQHVIIAIVSNKPLPAKHNAHKLSGEFLDCWECHILPDWLLIWRID